jgi:Tol biopolymer transport system component
MLEAAPLTSAPGNETNPAFSPDGSNIAYAWDGDTRDGVRSIYVRSVDGGNPLRLTRAADDDNPVWSQDASRIAFLRYTPAGAQTVIVPAVGGPEHIVGSVADVARLTEHKLLTWSPDPDELVVADNPPGATPTMNLHLYGLRINSGQRRILSDSPPGTNDMEPVFSPDGRNLAFLRVEGSTYDLHLLSKLGGPSRLLATVHGSVQGLTWSADSRYLIYSAEASTPNKLFFVPATGGTPAVAPFQFGSVARALTMSRHAGRVAFVEEEKDTNIWAKSSLDRSFHRLIASTRADEDPRISADGQRIAFTSNRSGKYEIWVCDRDGSNPHPVTAQGAFAGSSAWSPDGKTLAYDSGIGGYSEVWLVSADGGPSHRLLNPRAPSLIPNWSTDGTSIYFAGKGVGEIWRAPLSGAPAVQVTHHGGFEGFETFDSKYFYFVKGITQRGIWRLPLAGRPSEEKEELLPELASVRPSRYWAVAAEGIYYAESKPKPVLKFFRFQNRRTSVVADLPSPPQRAERGLSVSADGSFILYMQVDTTRHGIMVALTQ